MSEAIQAREASLKDKQIELGKEIQVSPEFNTLLARKMHFANKNSAREPIRGHHKITNRETHLVWHEIIILQTKNWIYAKFCGIFT